MRYGWLTGLVIILGIMKRCSHCGNGGVVRLIYMCALQQNGGDIADIKNVFLLALLIAFAKVYYKKFEKCVCEADYTRN